MFNWPSFAKQRVIDAVLFKNGTMEMDRFTTTADLKNLRLTFNAYNVTNADQVMNSSAKIQLQEIGPFVYHEYKTKEFIDNNQESGLITYKLRRQFVFKPELSVGDPKKMTLTWINVPVIAAISLIEKKSWFEKPVVRLVLNTAISSVGEKAFMTDTVENFIFTGSYRKLFNETVLAPFVPKKALPGGKFAVMYGKNDNWDPDRDYILTVSAGFGPNQTYRDLNQYKSMNGSSRLPFWKPEGDCNALRGTDGEFFGPFVNSSENLEVYSADICRKLSLKYRGQTIVDGISVYKYTLDEKSLQSHSKNPENACYCLSNSTTDCNLDGLIDLSTCVADGITASGSHFLHGSPELLERVAGVSMPNAAIDEPRIYVEPNTGLAIQVFVPLQINVKLTASSWYPIFKFFNESNPLIVPLLRVTEAAELSDDQATMLRNKLLILDSWLVSMVLGGAIVLVFVIITLIFVLCLRYRSARQLARGPSETDPLLPRMATGQVVSEGIPRGDDQ